MLHRDEQIFRTLVTHTPAPIAMLDREMKYMAVSRRYLEDYRLGEQDIIGRSHYEVFPEIPDRWKEIHKRCLSGATEKADDDPFPRHDGSLDWLRWEIRPWHESDGSIGGIILFSEVITERKRTVNELREKDKELQEAQRIGQIGNWELDPRSGAVSWSKEIYRLFGRDPALPAPSLDERIFTPKDDAIMRVAIQKCLDAGTPYEMDISLIHPDGATRWITARGEPKRDANGQITGVRGTVQDITLRKSVEQDLKLFRELINQSNDAIEVVDPETLRLLDFNEKECRDLGYSRDELLSMSIFDIDPMFNQAANEKANEHFRKSDTLVLETIHKRKDGSTFPVEASIKRVRLERDYNVVVVRDISERMRIEEERRQHAETVRRSLQESILAVAATLERRDPYTAGHQSRVATLATAIARELGLDADRVRGLELAAAIHDLGKIHVPAEILTKPGKLSDIEYAIVKTHAEAGYQILKDVHFVWPIADMIRQHHERLDGSGYPLGLKADQILPESKILAVADVVEAMASHRPYRVGLGVDFALAEIVKGRGLIYDAAAVDACVKLFREKNYQLPSV